MCRSSLADLKNTLLHRSNVHGNSRGVRGLLRLTFTPLLLLLLENDDVPFLLLGVLAFGDERGRLRSVGVDVATAATNNDVVVVSTDKPLVDDDGDA
jgi:hypothetical protein